VYQQILPYYGNTHTTSTVTSLQSTLFRHEARDLIRNAVNASEHDAVIFVSSGATGAVHKLVNAVTRAGKASFPPLVIAGPWEHHSNLLPWREIPGTQVFNVKDDVRGNVDLKHLEETIKEATGLRQPGQPVIGCFSAASNITGVKADVDAISVLLHRHKCLAVFDYATAAPHCKVDMNPVAADPQDQPFVHKDAVFISPHKFVGGVDTPGVLVTKKRLFAEASVPSEGGGGSVFFVTEQGHRYLQEVEMREEGGTPDIVGSIRAGLAFQLKEAVGADIIEGLDRKLARRAFEAWEGVPGLHILGPSSDIDRLPIFSLMFSDPKGEGKGMFLHHNFVSSLLNDMFGVQSRGGCACAGPYAQSLMGMDLSLASRYEALLLEDQRLDRTHLRRYREYSQNEVLRPGFVRLNLSFFASELEIDFLLEAVKWVAAHGHKILPLYLFNRETGEWHHKDHQVFRDRRWLGHISYQSGEMTWRDPLVKDKGPLPPSLSDCLVSANALLESLPRAEVVRQRLGDQALLFQYEADNLRWFRLPSETECQRTPPYHPKSFERLQRTSLFENDANSEKFETVDGYKCNELSLEKGDMEVTHNNVNDNDTNNSNNPLPPKDPSPNSIIIKSSQITTALDDRISLSSNGYKKGRDIQSCSTQSSNFRNKKERNSPKKDNQRNSLANLSNGVPRSDVNFPNPASDEACPANVESCPADAEVCPCLDFGREKPKSRLLTLQLNTLPKAKWFSPGKRLWKPTCSALEGFEMIHDGDRVLVCLSGGKDSLSLLHTLRQYQFKAKADGVSFTIGAVTVDPMSPSYDPSPLVPYLKALGVPYLYEEQDILGQAAACNPESICSFCSRMKRGRIYAAARREGYNVLAFGQHLDDLAESFLMSIFHNGLLRTMKANYRVAEGDLRVIRPFAFVREKDTRDFAEVNKLPVIPENCPACFEAPKERHRFKQLLASQELLFPDVYSNLLEAIKPLMSFNTNLSNGFKDKLIKAVLGNKFQDLQIDNEVL